MVKMKMLWEYSPLDDKFESFGWNVVKCEWS